MEPTNLRFGGGVAATVLHPVVALAVLVAGLMILLAPKQKALAAFLAAAILIPTDQVLVIGALHFPTLRILALLGFARILRAQVGSKQRVFGGGMTKIDSVVVLFSFFTAVNGILLWQDAAALIKQMGDIVSLLGTYFLLRSLVRDDSDVNVALKTFAVIAVIVAGVMTYELATGHNPYALLGGARASTYADVMEREDRARAGACFGHPILAGTFGAILLPLFVSLWWRGREFRKYAVIGVLACTVVTITSGSSTPIMAYAAGILALCLWPVRAWMRALRWGIVAALVSLHVAMKAPVWNLIARMDLVGGSSGEHRYQLVNMCIVHFWDWWLVGTKSNGDWGWGMWDTCNQYVAVSEYSGLIPLILLLAMIVYGFKFLGRAR